MNKLKCSFCLSRTCDFQKGSASVDSAVVAKKSSSARYLWVLDDFDMARISDLLDGICGWDQMQYFMF